MHPALRSGTLALFLLLTPRGASPALAQEWPRPGFRAAGLDSIRIGDLFARIADGTFPGIDAVVIVRHGALVAEAYFNGYRADRLHDIRSATKSITSILTGIAIDKGRLSPETPVVAFFPEYRPAVGWDPHRAALRVRDLLTMRTGLACNDFEPDSPGNEERMYPRADWSRFFFEIPPSAETTGRRFSYCTAGVVLLGEVLARAVGQQVQAFADTTLWQPLGIRGARWRSTPTGGAMTGGNLGLTPRDMAKVGLLLLQGGVYDGVRVVSAAWMERSCRAQVDERDSGFRYGFLWWLETPLTDATAIPSCHASGNGGQKIFVFPSADLVVVFTGSNYNVARLGHRQPVSILNQYILPALTPWPGGPPHSR